MVSTRPKNKLRGIPTGTKIDLTGETPSPSKSKQKPKPSPRKPIPMETSPTPSTKTTPLAESPSPVDERVIDELTAEIHAPTLETDEPHADAEEETPTPAAVRKSGDTSVKRKPSSASKKKPAAEKSATPAEGSSTEKNEPSGSIVQEKRGDSDQETEETPARKKRKMAVAAIPLRMIKGESSSATRSRKKVAEPHLNKGIAIPKIPDFESLGRLGIAEKVKEYFQNVGWGPFLKWPEFAYEEIVREVFDSVKVEINPQCGPLGMSFTMKGESRDVSVNELNMNLGMVRLSQLQKKDYKEAKRGVPFFEAPEWDAMWTDIGDGGAFVTQKTKGHRIRDPALRVCHRILSYTFFGKKDSGNAMSKKDLYILWAMAKKVRLNFGAFLIEHIASIISKPNQRLSCIHFTTAFAQENEIEIEMGNTRLEAEALNLESLVRMKDVRMVDGEPRFTTPDDREPAAVEDQSPAVGKGKGKRKVETISTGSEDDESQLDRIEDKLEATQIALQATQKALLAFFKHQGFRYPPEPQP